MELLNSEGCYCAQGQDCPHWIETQMEQRIISIKERTHERMPTAEQEWLDEEHRPIVTELQRELRSALHEIEKLATTSRDLAKMNQELEEARLQAVSDQTRAAKRLMLMSSQLEYTEQKLYKLTQEVDDGQRDSDLLRIERIKREALQEREDASRLTIEALQDELQETQRSERSLQQKLTTIQTKYETLGKRYELMKRQQQEQELARESKEALAWLKETTDRLCSPPQGSLAHQYQEKSSSHGSGLVNYSPGSSPTYSSSFMDPPLAAQNQLISLIKELATTNSTLRSELGEYRDLLQDARNEVLMLRAQVEDFEHSHIVGGCCGNHGGDEMASSMRTSKSAWSGLDPNYPGLDAVSHIGTLGTSVPGSPPPYMSTAMAPSQQHHHHHIHLPGVRGNVFGELDRLYSQQQQQQLQELQKHRDKTKRSHRKTSRASDPSSRAKSPRRHHHHHHHHQQHQADTASGGIQTVSTSTSTSELRRGGGSTPTLGGKRLSQTSNHSKKSSQEESSSLSPSSHRSRKSQYTDVDMDMLDSGTERDDRDDFKAEAELDDDPNLMISDSGSASDDQAPSFIAAFAEGHSRTSTRRTAKVLLPPATLGDELAAFGGLNPPMSDKESCEEDMSCGEEPSVISSPLRDDTTNIGQKQQPHALCSPSTPVRNTFDEGVLLTPQQQDSHQDHEAADDEDDDDDDQERLQLNRTSSVSLLSSGIATAKRASTQSLHSLTTPNREGASLQQQLQQQQPQLDPRDDTSTPVPTGAISAAAMAEAQASWESDTGDDSRVGPLDLDLTGKRMSEYDMIRLESAVSALDRGTPKYPQFALHDKSASEQDFMTLRQRRRLSEPWQAAGIGKGSYSYRPRQSRPGSIYSLRRAHRQSQQYSPRLYSSSVMGVSSGNIHGIMGGVGGSGSSQSFVHDSSRYLNPELAEQRVVEQRKRMMEAWRVGVVAAAVTQQQSVHTIAAFDQKKMDLETMSIRSKVSRRSKTSRHRNKGKDRVAPAMDLELEEHDLELPIHNGGRGSLPQVQRTAGSLEEFTEAQSITTTNDNSTLATNFAATVSTAPTEVTTDQENTPAKSLGMPTMHQTAVNNSSPLSQPSSGASAGHDTLSTPPSQQQQQHPALTINTSIKTPLDAKTPKTARKRRSFNPRLQTPRSTKSPIRRSPYIPRLSRAERQFPSETSGISEFSTRHMGHHHGPYQLLHTLAAELLERLVRSDTRELNRRLQRTFDIHALSQMSNSVIENVLTDVNNLGERFRWVEAQVAEPEDELIRTAAADTASLHRTSQRFLGVRRTGATAAASGSSNDAEGSIMSARMSSASETSGSDDDDVEGEDDEEFDESASDFDDDDDALSDEMDWNFSVEEFFPLAHLVQEMLSEVGRLRMTINELQLSYVQKVEQDRLRAEKDFQDELENDEATGASSLLEPGHGKDGRRRQLGDIAEEGSSGDALAGFKTLLSKKRDRPKILETASTGVSGFFSKVFGGGASSGNAQAQATAHPTGVNSNTTTATATLLAAAAPTGAKVDPATTPGDVRALAQRKPTGVTTETSKVFAGTAWISSPRRTLTGQTASSNSSTVMAVATPAAEVSSSSSSSSFAASGKQQDLNTSGGGGSSKVANVLYRSATASKLSAAASLTSIAAASPARKWTGLSIGTTNSSTQESLASAASGGVGGSSSRERDALPPSLPIPISPSNKGLASTLAVSANISPTLIGVDAHGQPAQAEAQLARSLPSIRSMHLGLEGHSQGLLSSSPTEASSFNQVAAAVAAFAQGERVDEDDDDIVGALPSSSMLYSNPNKSTSVLIGGSAPSPRQSPQQPQRQLSLLASPARLRSMAHGRTSGPALSVVTHQDMFEEHWASISTPASPRLTKTPGRAATAVLGGGAGAGAGAGASENPTSPIDSNLAEVGHDSHNAKGLAATVSSSSSSVMGVEGGSSGVSSAAVSLLIPNLASGSGSGSGSGGVSRAVPSVRSSTSIHTLSVASTPSSTTAPSWIESRRSSSNVPPHFTGGQGDASASLAGSLGSGGVLPPPTPRATDMAPPPSDAAAYLRLHQQQLHQQQQQQQQQPFALIRSELGALFGGAQHGASTSQTTPAAHGYGNGSVVVPQSANFGLHKGKSVATSSSLASTSTGTSSAAKVSVEILDQDPEELERGWLSTVVENDECPQPSLSLSAAAKAGEAMARRKGSVDSYEQSKSMATTTTTAVAFDHSGETVIDGPRAQVVPTEQLPGRRKTIMSMVTTSAGAPSSFVSSSLTPSVFSNTAAAASTMSLSASMAPPISQKTGSTSTAVAYVVAIPEQPSILDDPHSETGMSEESVLGVISNGHSQSSGGGGGGVSGGSKKRPVFDRELIRASQKRILANIATTGSLHPTLDSMASSSSSSSLVPPRSAAPKSATAVVKSYISSPVPAPAPLAQSKALPKGAMATATAQPAIPSTTTSSARRRHQRSLSVDSLQSNEPLQEKEVMDFWRVGAGVSRDLWGAFKKKLESSMPDSQAKAAAAAAATATGSEGEADKDTEKENEVAENQ